MTSHIGAGTRGTNSQFGLLQRNAEETNIYNNTFTGNCVGIVILAGAPGPSGHARIHGNPTG